MTNWKPISTVPMDTTVIVSDGNEMTIGLYSKARTNTVWFYPEGISGYDLDIEIEPTHWTEVPELPEAAK